MHLWKGAKKIWAGPSPTPPGGPPSFGQNPKEDSSFSLWNRPSVHLSSWEVVFNAIFGLGGWDWDWMVIKSHKPSKNTFRANTIHGNTRSKISTLLSDLNPPATATQLVFQYSNRTCPVTKNPTCWALLEHARVIITQLLSQVMVSVKARWDQINHACLSPPLLPLSGKAKTWKVCSFW